MNLDTKEDTPLDEAAGENEGEPNEDHALLTSEREDQLWCQIGETQKRAFKLGFEFAKLHGGYLGLERVVHLELSQETSWGLLSKDVFEALCGEDSGGVSYESENAFWRKMFDVTSQQWFPTSVQIVAFVAGVYAFWTPVREELGL